MNYVPKEEILLEESIDTISKEKLDSLELPLSRKTFIFMATTTLAIGLVVVARVLFLGEWRSDFYQARAAINAGKEVRLSAARGIIYDRFQKPLVENKPTFSVGVKVKDLLKYPDVSELADLLNIGEEEIKEALNSVDLEKVSSLIIARDISPETVIKLKSANLPGVEIIDDYKRIYANGPALAHILGYSGPDKENEISGKVGLEAFYNQFLRGRSGEYILYRDTFGNILDQKTVTEPATGYRLNTTLDFDLQQYFYNRISSAIASLGSSGGVGIAINTQTGEILSIVSLPSFDSNIFGKSGHNKEKSILLNSVNKPLFNRPVAGVYSPGSTIKPLMALAALKEGIVNPQKEVYSAGFIEIPNPYFPDQPSRFLDWKAHGWVNLHSALAKSSNIYFYAIGGGFEDIRGLGINKIKEYWQKFGFGQKTGIDLPSESEGYLPDPELKEQKTGDIWRLGDTYNISIGQGDFLATPIQLINYITVVANGGRIYKPFLGASVVDSNGKMILENYPEVIKDFSDWKAEIVEAQIGMEDAVSKPYGTAHLLNDLPVKAAGKTGSAQISNNTKTNAFFVGYFPANPLPSETQIAILVLIENARAGSLNAVPIAKDVLNWYYWNRLATSY